MKKKVIGFIILLLVLSLGLSIDSYAVVYNLVNKETQASNYEAILSALNEQFNIRLDKNASGMNYSTYLGNWSNANVKFFRYGYETYGTRYTYYWDYGNTKVFSGNPTTQNLSVSPYHCYHVENWRTGPYEAYYESGSGSISMREPNTVYYCLYIDENNNIWEYSSTDFSITDSLGPSIAFDNYSDGTIDVFYNGSSDTFLKYNLSRSVNSWALGKITGYDDSLKIDVRLNRYMNGEFTTNVGHAQWYNGQFSTFGGLSITGDGVVYINNDKIYYEQGYYLTIDLDGENILNFPIYFLPYASTLVSGDLLSPDIDTNNDLEILQNLQELVNIQNIGSIYDSNFSGDSGDVLLGTLDYKEYNNDYSNYISTTLMSLREYMLGSGDVAFSFNFMGNNMTVHSNDFYVPNGTLKFFVTSFLVFATIYYLYVQASHFFHKLQEGDFESAIETYAVNDESVLM